MVVCSVRREKVKAGGREGLLNVAMTSRMHPGILILDAHHLSSALSRSLMAAASWRSSSRLLVPALVHARTATPFPRLGFHVPACVKAQGAAWISLRSSAPASFRLMATVPSSSALYAVSGFAPCRAANRDACAVEQHRNGDCLKPTPREGIDFLRDNVGSIHLIMGPMFAGKTTALLKRIQKESDAGRCFLTFFFCFLCECYSHLHNG